MLRPNYLESLVFGAGLGLLTAKLFWEPSLPAAIGVVVFAFALFKLIPKELPRPIDQTKSQYLEQLSLVNVALSDLSKEVAELKGAMSKQNLLVGIKGLKKD